MIHRWRGTCGTRSNAGGQSVWDELVDDLRYEVEQLDRAVDLIDDILPRALAASGDNDSYEMAAALGATLHSFYNGLEAAFKTIARRVDGRSPAGDRWHRDLLEQMTVSTGF